MPCGGGGELTSSPFSRPAYCLDFDSYATLEKLLADVKSSSWEADFLCDVKILSLKKIDSATVQLSMTTEKS